MKPILRASALSFRFPGSNRRILNAVDLTIEAGERILLAGPSGTGKSTLLCIAAGLVPRYVAGTLEGELSLSTERVAIVFQSPEAQMIAPTVEEEIAFGLENLARPAAEIRGLIARLADELDIGELLSRNPSELSGGEQQRVALAAALAMEPELLLLDEPTSYLDPDTTRALFELLDRLHPQTALLVVEHKLDQILERVERLLLLDEEGRLSDRGSPQDLELGEFLPWRLERLAGKKERPEGASSLEGPKPLLSATNLIHSYDRKRSVLHGASLAAAPGEIVVVMGRSGAGKSTLLGRLSGLLPGRPGQALLAEVDLARSRPKTRYAHLLALPQNPEHFFLRESVAEELLLASSPASERRGAALELGSGPGLLPPLDERARQAARAFRLERLLARNPFSLSEGEKRRLNLACAFLDDRPLLLLDEPTYGLDYDAFEQLVVSLRLLASRGAATVVVTHSPELAWLVADRVLLLEGGRIRDSFSPPEASRDPSQVPDRLLPAWLRARRRNLPGAPAVDRPSGGSLDG